MRKKTVPNETFMSFFYLKNKEHDKFDITEQRAVEILSIESFINISFKSLAKTVSNDGTMAQELY